jgi:glucoamylase
LSVLIRSGTAPGGSSDLVPTWTSSAKDLVTTALGPSRVWATIGHGILNEVYWPSTGEPQIRDLGFIVAGPHGWSEIKRVNLYTLTTPQPEIPLPTIVHAGADYRLTLEIVPDPSRDALLIRYALEGDELCLYPLLAPRLGTRGHANTALVGDEVLWARGAGAWLCLACSPGFSRASAGRVGTSDGWQDFAANGRMTWTWERAGPGNVALLAECAENSGVLALGFGHSKQGATTLARSSLAAGFATARALALGEWRDWASRVDLTAIAGLPGELVAQARRSAAVLRVHEDLTFPGAVVASLSVPWGNSHDDLGGYHLVWARDAVNAGLGLLAIGLVDDARRMLAYLVAMQHPDGHWAQNFYPDGRPFWKGLQLDEVGYPILLATKMREAGLLAADDETAENVTRMVGAAAGFIVRNGPVTPQDRWEENSGLNGHALAIVVAALVAAAEWLQGEERACVLEVADTWNASIEDWLYAAGTDLARAHGVHGHYVRIVPDARRPIGEQALEIHNRDGLTLRADQVVALDFLALVALGLRRADDKRVQDTVRVCDAVLGIETPLGRTFHRYNEDGYGEKADGAPFDGRGIGRGWPLLSGERGHFAVVAAEEALPWLAAMERMTGPNGMSPEQVWDAAPIPGAGLLPGQPTGSAMPLVWAHAEFVKLALAIGTGRPFLLLDGVRARYGMAAPTPSIREWRSETPHTSISRRHALRLVDHRPFVLHFTLDGWRTVQDRRSAEMPFGTFAVTLDFDAADEALIFTRRYGDDWEGEDHRVELLD